MNTIICTLSLLCTVLVAQAAVLTADQQWEAFKVRRAISILIMLPSIVRKFTSCSPGGARTQIQQHRRQETSLPASKDRSWQAQRRSRPGYPHLLQTCQRIRNHGAVFPIKNYSYNRANIDHVEVKARHSQRHKWFRNKWTNVVFIRTLTPMAERRREEVAHGCSASAKRVEGYECHYPRHEQSNSTCIGKCCTVTWASIRFKSLSKKLLCRWTWGRASACRRWWTRLGADPAGLSPQVFQWSSSTAAWRAWRHQSFSGKPKPSFCNRH